MLKNCNVIVIPCRSNIHTNILLTGHTLYFSYIADDLDFMSNVDCFVLLELKSGFLKALILSELSLTEADVGPELPDTVKQPPEAVE